MNRTRNKAKKSTIICLCHQVEQKKIEQAIARGCNTLSKIFDATNAGVGPCGGSCRPILKVMLEHYLNTGKHLENPRKAIKNKK